MKGHNIAVGIFSIILIITGSFGIMTIPFAYSQTNQTSSFDVQNIPAKKVHVGDINIAYKLFGKGDPFLLISGSGLVMDAWDPTMLRDLASNHTVIIFDNRGVGNTTAGDKPFSIAQFANDTAGLLDTLKIQKADVLGFSMASFIAQELVKILSDIVNNRLQDQEKALSVSYPLSWIKSHPNFTIPQPTETISPDTLKKQFNIVERWFATNWSGICGQLSKMSVPTLVITGTEDIAVPAANSLIIAQKIPGSWLVQIKGGGHSLMYQYPKKLSKVMETFLTTT